MDRTPFTVRHDVAQSRFEVEIEGQLAVCDYRRREGVLDITHTEVPRSLEGRGIAGALVARCLAWARAEGLRVRPLCSYVGTYMRRHPETRDLLAD